MRRSNWCRFVYDSCQFNQFNIGKMWKCIDSNTMNRYNLNIPINSIMLLITYMNRLNQLTRITQMIQSGQSITSICCWPFIRKTFGKHLGYIFSIFEPIELYSIIPIGQSQSTQSLLYESELTQSPITSLGKGTESINQFCGKKMIRFKSIKSIELIELIGMQIWIDADKCLKFRVDVCPSFKVLSKYDRGQISSSPTSGETSQSTLSIISLNLRWFFFANFKCKVNPRSAGGYYPLAYFFDSSKMAADVDAKLSMPYSASIWYLSQKFQKNVKQMLRKWHFSVIVFPNFG